MLAIVYALQTWSHYVLGTADKTKIFSDHQNLEYFTKMVKSNKGQAQWAEILQEYNFVIIYHKGSLNQHADILSRSQVYTIGEGGTIAITEKPILGQNQWLEIGGMEGYDDTLEYIDIGGLDIMLLGSDQKEEMIKNGKLDDDYIQLCKRVTKGKNINLKYGIQEDVLTWKGRLYVPRDIQNKVMKSEHDSTIEGHFSRDRTMELISPNCLCLRMEDKVQ